MTTSFRVLLRVKRAWCQSTTRTQCMGFEHMKSTEDPTRGGNSQGTVGHTAKVFFFFFLQDPTIHCSLKPFQATMPNPKRYPSTMGLARAQNCIISVEHWQRKRQHLKMCNNLQPWMSSMDLLAEREGTAEVERGEV